jgi:hypothetical protein
LTTKTGGAANAGTENAHAAAATSATMTIRMLPDVPGSLATALSLPLSLPNI